jgi:uncharacterized protein (DUF885 family)
MTCALLRRSETARGDYRDNSRLDDYSLDASKKQNATDREHRARLEAISTEGFPEQRSFVGRPFAARIGQSLRGLRAGFHDEILSGGILPLDMLEARVDSWIGSQLRGAVAR